MAAISCQLAFRRFQCYSFIYYVTHENVWWYLLWLLLRLNKNGHSWQNIDLITYDTSTTRITQYGQKKKSNWSATLYAKSTYDFVYLRWHLLKYFSQQFVIVMIYARNRSCSCFKLFRLCKMTIGYLLCILRSISVLMHR